MPNVSPGITIPGIPSAGAFGYPNTNDQLVYDPALHIGNDGTPAAGIVAQLQGIQNQFTNFLPANVGNAENGLITGWAAYNGTLANVTTGPAHSGTHAFRFTGTGTGPSGTLSYQAGSGVTIPASYVGYQISATAWVFNPSAPLRAVNMQLTFLTSGFAQFGTVNGPSIVETQNNWILVPPVITTVPATAAYVWVNCTGPGIGTANEIRYFDDFALAMI